MKILVIRLSSLGDIILTQPIMQRLHEVFPDAELHFLTKEEYRMIPQFFGIPMHTVSYKKTIGFHLSLLTSRYDYVFDLHGKFSSILTRWLCIGAKEFVYNKQRGLRKKIIRHNSNHNINSTLDLYQSALLKASKKVKNISLSEGLNNPKLYISEADIDNMQKLYPKPEGKKVIALFPGATHFAKMYPLESYIRMVQSAGSIYHFWLFGSPPEMNLTKTIHAASKSNSTDFGGKFSIPDLIKIIAVSDAVITNDSGPMHIAAALNKPQVAIFGSTHPRLGFKPLNDNAKVICKDISCQPCTLHGGKKCPQRHFACMLSIEPEEILSILDAIA